MEEILPQDVVEAIQAHVNVEVQAKLGLHFRPWPSTCFTSSLPP
jgi:hypothetical protein